MDTADDFQTEIETLAEHLLEWLESGHEGEWVALRGREFVGPFRLFADAWDAGVERLGAEGLIVERIERECSPLLIANLQEEP